MSVAIKNTWPSLPFRGWIAMMKNNKNTEEKTTNRISSLAATEVLTPPSRVLESHMTSHQR
jgi:hypothetical protein